MSDAPATAIVVGAEMFFKGKIAAAGGRARLIFIDSEAGLDEALGATKPGLVILNLEAAGLDPIAALARIRASTSAHTAGYANHTREDLMARAREAGCDVVLSKGAFSKALPELLADAEG